MLFLLTPTNMKNCSSRNHCKNSRYLSMLSWMPGILIAILPKCPFCIMAYSGAVTLCSGTSLYPNSGSTAVYLSLGIALFIIVSIAFNYKGRRTMISLGICSLAIGLLLLSQLVLMDSAIYTVASLILLFGIWYNGSFFYFYNKIKYSLRHRFLNSNKITHDS